MWVFTEHIQRIWVSLVIPRHVSIKIYLSSSLNNAFKMDDRLASTIKTASWFNGASKIAVKTRCHLSYVLAMYTFPNLSCHRNPPWWSQSPSPQIIGRRRWRSQRHLVRRLLYHKIDFSNQTIYIEGVPVHTEAIDMQGFKVNRPCDISAGEEAAAMVNLANLKGKCLCTRGWAF